MQLVQMRSAAWMGRRSGVCTATNLRGTVGQAGPVGKDGDVAWCRPAGQHRVAGLVDGPDMARKQDPPGDDSRDGIGETDHAGHPVACQVA
jgi:hypothetical protein